MNRSRITSIALIASLATLLLLASSSQAVMRSKKLSATLCETTGGGKIVDIPGFPGEKIDRRLLADIRQLKRKYKIFVTDGYSGAGVHAVNGEHPMGLALDITPDFRRGGSWRLISRLAKAAEPRQDRPVPPFRWVGYNGDSGHGRGHHLHLSWNHSVTKPGKIAKTVYTTNCPGAGPGGGGGNGNQGGGNQSGGGDQSGPGGTSGGIGGTSKPKQKKAKHKKRKGGNNNSGGIMAGTPKVARATISGGLSVSQLSGKAAVLFTEIAPVVETGGVDGR